MSVTYGFFNSLNGDRLYNADQMSEYFEGLVSDGVYESVGGALQVLAGTGMTVNVQTGRAIVRCKWVDLDAVETLQVTAAHAILNRYTAVVVRLDVTNRQIFVTTKDGTPASNPVKPAITDSTTVKELCLAMIYVPAGSTAITQDNITDMRASSDCGWVTGLIKQVDTSQLFLQWQTAYENYYRNMTEAFNTWFSALTEQLNVNTFINYYDKRVTLNGSVTDVPLNMTGYTYDESDIINVYINGLYAVEGRDYTLTVSGGIASISDLPAVSGTVIAIRVLRSQIGWYALSAGNNDVLSGNNNEGLSA